MNMHLTSRYDGTLDYVITQWPKFVFGYAGGLLLALAFLYLSVIQDWPSFIILSLTVAAVLIYFLAGSLWAAHLMYDNDVITEKLLTMGNVKAEDMLAHINLGPRRMAYSLARRLITGKVTVVDVYNPQLTPNSALARSRQRALQDSGQVSSDPRLAWRDGSINLLPLPDGSVSFVIMIFTLSEFWQRGDQIRLLKEIGRILTPGGHLLLAERVRTPTNIALLGPASLRLKSPDYWNALIEEGGFHSSMTVNQNDLVYCMKVDKRPAKTAGQLTLNL